MDEQGFVPSVSNGYDKIDSIQKNIKWIEQEIPKWNDLFQSSLISALNKENVKVKVVKLLEDLWVDTDYSCFDTDLIPEIQEKLKENNIALTKEQARIIRRINKIIQLNVENLEEQITRARYDDWKDQSINYTNNKTLYLLMKKNYNYNDLNYLLEQKLDPDLFRKVHDYLIKRKFEIRNEWEYKNLYLKLLKNKGVDKEYLEQFIIQANVDNFDEKSLIIESWILNKREIRELLFKDDHSSLWWKIMSSQYADNDMVIILLNKVTDNYVRNYKVIKQILINNVFPNKNIELSDLTLEFLLAIYKEDKDIMVELNKKKK